MAVKIRLKRMGQIRAPHYRIVVADSRNKRDGRAIEEVGIYNPMTHPSTIEVKSERVQYWLGVGAQPTEQVAALLKVTGDWQKFKGLPGAEGTYQVPAANTKAPRIPAGGSAKAAQAPAEAPAEAETPASES
ncbi:MULTISPECIES: 30S ribosomal protein S16 [Kineococcus]|uniref:30S ribosomal protein S16 n=1 Tax=Kineococcus TaxID=33981 RepID=UPI001411BF59|nr:30S ribosomal protein S16 [Kineococcus vitellinus]